MSVISQTLYPPQSIFTEVQAIHDTGVYYNRELDQTGNLHTEVSKCILQLAWVGLLLETLFIDY